MIACSKNKLLILKLFLLITVTQFTSGCSSILSHYLLPNKNVRAKEYRVVKEELSIITSDGIVLVSDVYRPKNIDKTPTILIRIPFRNSILNRLRSKVIGEYWSQRGYTVVIQGARGRYKSTGEFYPLINEEKDGIETLKWISEKDWYNGKIGMWGGSVFGYSQWVLADQTSVDVDAYIIQICSTSFYDMF